MARSEQTGLRTCGWAPRSLLHAIHDGKDATFPWKTGALACPVCSRDRRGACPPLEKLGLTSDTAPRRSEVPSRAL